MESQFGKTPVVYNLTLTVANSEYSIAIPGTVKAIEWQARQSADVRYQFITGKVAASTSPYMTMKADGSYAKGSLYWNNPTLYFASATAGTVVEITVWL